jgi:hypothetical protein
MGAKEFDRYIDLRFPCIGPRVRQGMLEACSPAAIRVQPAISLPQTLLSDDAPVFRFLFDEQSLCWVPGAPWGVGTMTGGRPSSSTVNARSSASGSATGTSTADCSPTGKRPRQNRQRNWSESSTD